MATRLPREKIPLAVRKQVRDEFDSKKPDFEKQLSDILGQKWTIDVDTAALWPYAARTNEQTLNSFGFIVQHYITGAIYRFERHAEEFGAMGIQEINSVAHTHILTIDLDETISEDKAFAYCGVDIHEGKIRLLFAATAFGSNPDHCFDNGRLLKALQNAPPPPGGGGSPEFSFEARTSIAQDWEPRWRAVRDRLAGIVGKDDISLEPNFEDTYAKLQAERKRAGTVLGEDWEKWLGRYTFSYFDTLVSLMPGFPDDFEQDEMLKEGFVEAVSTGRIVFRIVDKLVNDSRQMCECQLEDGVLYLQTTAGNFGSNPNEVYNKLTDQL